MGRIANLLIEKLSRIYCHNCKNNDDEDKCEGCNRKSMKWQLSQEEAESIEKEIDDIK